MRVHIDMESSLIERIDEVAGERGRSQFVRDAVLAALENAQRRAYILAAAGSVADTGHEWDDDPAAWVRSQRRLDPRRVG
jgi:hypothetical protein